MLTALHYVTGESREFPNLSFSFSEDQPNGQSNYDILSTCCTNDGVTRVVYMNSDCARDELVFFWMFSVGHENIDFVMLWGKLLSMKMTVIMIDPESENGGPAPLGFDPLNN